MTLIKPYSASFYVGDNETKEFPFTFDEVSESFVKVLVSNADGSVSIPTYTVDLQLKQVVFGDETPAPTDDDVVCIYRATPVIQDTPFRTLQGYNAQALENILSKIVAMIQEIKSTYFSTQILQGEAWQLDLLKSEDNGATVNIDYVAKKLVKGLYFQIKDGNLQVSADGNSYITMPKSVDVAEFRQREVILPDLTVVYKLEYRVGNIWYDAGGTAESKADEAIQIAEEARDIANEAKEIAEDAKETAEGIDGKAQEALDKSSEAVDKVEELEEKIIVKSDIIPTASADLVGSVYQYVGATNGSYTHGYIYECKAIPADTLVFTPDTISCSWTDLSAFLQTETADYNSVVAGTMTYFADAELWRLVFTDANGDTVLTYQQYTGDWEDVGFTFNDIFHDGDVVSFARYTVATHIWERIDVQPNHNEDIAELHDEVANLKGLGRFLSVWNCATGLAETNPPQSPYTYHTGDYFLVGTVGTTNYRPDGATYTTGVASTTVETNEVKVNDVYIYDGTNWKLQANSQRDVAFSGIVGSPYDNTNLSTALNAKQGTISDLSEIRSGAALGATAVQPSDLATVATTGDYDDLLNKPTIPAAQVNSDWNANSGVAQILNKPTLATVATSGSYNDLSDKPTIPTVNNSTITITQGGVTKGSFTLNQATGGTIPLDAGGGVGNIDNVTITANADDEIQAVAVIDQNTGIAKTWTGTMAEYEAIVTKDPETEYIIIDDIGGSATEIGEITEALNDKVDKGHQVIEFQAPMAANNYTWYRKYADGWVEQGQSRIAAADQVVQITFPIEMADEYYVWSIGRHIYQVTPQNTNEAFVGIINRTTTGFMVADKWGHTYAWCWQVSGIAAS